MKHRIDWERITFISMVVAAVIAAGGYSLGIVLDGIQQRSQEQSK